MAETPASFIFSTSATPACGCDRASPSSAWSLAPPSDSMPAAALMSPMAISAPRRHCCPEWASAPVTGCSTPTLTVLGFAPATSGKATALATAADCDTKRRRLCIGLSFFSVELDWPGRHVLAGPHLRVDAAHAGELHFVGVAVGAVQAMKTLPRLIV